MKTKYLLLIVGILCCINMKAVERDIPIYNCPDIGIGLIIGPALIVTKKNNQLQYSCSKIRNSPKAGTYLYLT